MKQRILFLSIPVLALGVLALGPADDKIISSRGSLFLNIDHDNDSMAEVFEITRDAMGGAVPLVTVLESGALGIHRPGFDFADLEVALDVVGSRNIQGMSHVAARFRALATDGPNGAGVVIGSLNGNAPFIGDTVGPSGTSLGLYFRTDNAIRMRITRTGEVAIGFPNWNVLPAANLHVNGFSDADLLGGGGLVLGSVAGLNIVADNNEIMARNNGSVANLHLNADGGNVIISDHVGTGSLIVPVIQITGADLAEKFPVSEDVEPGMVMAIDPDRPGQLRVARVEYDRRVAGVVSGANDLATGVILGNLPGTEDALPIALSGRVWVYCDASDNPIKPGDLLTTSSTPGHAMKVTDYPRAQGAIIGKAMSSLEDDRGLVLVLVSLQ